MPISNRSVERLSAALKLDADQKSLVRSLYAGYRSSFKQAAETGDAELRAQNEKMHEDKANAEQNYRQIAKDRIRITREFVTKAEKLEKSFLEDLKALLTPQQAAGFERAERTRRREVGLKFSFIAGEGIDIFQILHELKIDRDTPALKEDLDRYDSDLDRAMVEKGKMLRSVLDQMEKLEGPEPDPTLIEKTLKEFFTSGTRVRDMHRECVRKVVNLLPEDKQKPFERAVKKASFPRVYAEGAVDKTFTAANNLSLSDDQKAQLAAVAETYGRDADAANTRWSAAIEDKQSKMSDNIMGMMGGPGEEASDDPLKLARDARRGLDERTITRISAVLTPDQKEKLPKIEPDKTWHGQEYLPDFDEFDAWEEWKKEDEGETPSQPAHPRGK